MNHWTRGLSTIWPQPLGGAKLRLLIAAMAAIALAGFAAPVHAASIVFNFDTPANTDVGPTHTFTATDGFNTIDAYGFLNDGTATDLYTKFTSGDPTESGLGTNSDPQNEINTTNFAQLDLTPYITSGDTALTLIASVQTGEGFNLLAANKGTLAGSSLLCTDTGGGIDSCSFSLASLGGKDFLSLTATSGNVLLNSLTLTPTATPEVSSLVLFGIGLVGFALVIRRQPFFLGDREV